jgi:DNA polymerase III subunit delta
MSVIKSHEFDSFLDKSAELYDVFLIYGPDRGLVSERAGQIARKTGVALDDAFAVIKLEASDLAKDPGRLADEMQSIGLFGGKRLIWVKNAAAEKSLPDALKQAAQLPGHDSILIVEAGDLKKTSSLRKIAETERKIAAVACYQDDGRALNTLIDQTLAQEKLSITPDARRLLLDVIGGDRIASRNEIEKLCLYCRGENTIELHHVTNIVGDASAISVDDAVDAVLKGDSEALLHAIAKISASKTSIFLVLQACLKQFQLMDTMRAEMDDSRAQPAQIMASLGRHIHFARKPLVEAALRFWNAPAIARELNRMQSAILQSRQRQSLEESIAVQTLLSITLQSARQARKQ